MDKRASWIIVQFAWIIWNGFFDNLKFFEIKINKIDKSKIKKTRKKKNKKQKKKKFAREDRKNPIQI